MRKIIALLLVIVTVLGLAACENQEEKPHITPPSTETTVTAPVIDMTPHVIEGKQAFWEQVFMKSTLRTASDSFIMDVGDVHIKAQRDKQGNMFVGYDSAQDTNSSLPAVYISKNKTGYMHNIPQKMLDEQPNENPELATADTWALLTFETDEDEKELDTFLQNLQNELTPIKDLAQLIERIEYVHTINNQDYLKAYYTEIDRDKAPALIPDRDASVLIYGLYEFVVDEQAIQFVYLQESINGFTFSHIKFMDDITGTYNPDTNMITFGSEKYKCTVIVDYSKTKLPSIEYCVDLVMEPKTQSLFSAKGELYHVPFTVEFTECEKAYDVMNIPFFTDTEFKFATIAQEYIEFVESDIAFEAMNYYKHNMKK